MSPIFSQIAFPLKFLGFFSKKKPGVIDAFSLKGFSQSGHPDIDPTEIDPTLDISI